MGRKNNRTNSEASGGDKNSGQRQPQDSPRDGGQHQQFPQQGSRDGGQRQQTPQVGRGDGQQQQQGGRGGGQRQQPPQQGSRGDGQQQQQGGRGGGQRQQPPQQGGRDDGQQQQQAGRGGGQRQQPPQQGSRGDGQQQQQGGRGGGQRQQPPQQGGRDDGQQQQQGGRGGGQRQQPPQQGSRGDGQQQGGRGGGQRQQPPQQGGRGDRQHQQQGSWGGGQGQQPPQQGGRGDGQHQQQGAWGGGQRQQPPQQGGRGDGQHQQQGAWGGGQRQQPPQQGGRGDGQHQQQGAWGGGQRQQPPQQGGRGDGQHQQQGAWGGGQRQQPPQQGGRGDGQHQQQGAWGGGQRQQPPQQGGRGSLNQQMAKLSISNEPPLPNKTISCNNIVRGTLGKPGTVEVNYLKLDLTNMPNEAYHYDVTINPDRPKKFLRPAFEQCQREAFPNIHAAFDGMKSCYTLKRLPTPIDCKIEVSDSGNRTKEFQVQIKETDTCVVDLNVLRTYQNERVFDKPMRALQVLEVVMASNNHLFGVRAGRSFFRKPENPFDLEDGFEAWTGLYQAAILGEEPLLNVDISHKSFPSESTVISYLKKKGVDLTRPIDRRDFTNLRSFLKDINIVYTPPESFGAFPKTYKVLDIGDPADIKKFKTDDGKEQTVANYFRSRGYALQYPKLNCIQVGSSVRQISLPIELCSIPGGQCLNRKDKDQQVRNMIRFAATSTNVRKAKIMDLLNYFKHNDNEMIHEFGLRIGSNFIKVPMRLLPEPYLEYLQGRTVTTAKGAWRMDNLKFLITSRPQNGHKWAILFEEGKYRKYGELENFKTAVIQTSRSLNMNLQDTADILGYTYRDLPSKFRDLANKNYDLVFVVLSDFGTSYAKIKQVAELEVGILTQCIKEKTLFRTARDRTVFSNILLKVNGKLNGTNHKLAQDTDSKLKELMAPIHDVMYLGADVTHPSPDQRHIPSVVGVAASHDMYGACYNCQYRLQTSKNENIEDMESIALKHLEIYNKYQRKYPSKIIYYRDGVSDGQFPQVKREEVRCIKNACKKIGCDPKLTCIIVVKRHHTRFFPLSQPRDARDFNNVQPGSVVDQHITHPNEVQFFMVSHQSIQGTAKPTRYNVIVDESNFDINLLQKLTYNLCHLFPRCNRAVSYPAPAYLAHLVAFRGRVYIDGTSRFDKNLKKEYEKRLIRPEFMNKNPMYFI